MPRIASREFHNIGVSSEAKYAVKPKKQSQGGLSGAIISTPDPLDCLPLNKSRKSNGSGVKMWPRLGRPGSASWVLLRISSLKNHQMCNSREAILGK